MAHWGEASRWELAQRGKGWLSGVRRGSEGCSVAQVGCGMAQRGDEWLSGVRRG